MDRGVGITFFVENGAHLSLAVNIHGESNYWLS
jgi:hypothetical protein